MGDLGLRFCTLYRVQQFPPTLRAVHWTHFISYVILFSLLLALAQTETLLSARADPAAGERACNLCAAIPPQCP